MRIAGGDIETTGISVFSLCQANQRQVCIAYIAHIEEVATRLEISHFQPGWLQAGLDPRYLLGEGGCRVIWRLTWTYVIERARDDTSHAPGKALLEGDLCSELASCIWIHWLTEITLIDRTVFFEC